MHIVWPDFLLITAAFYGSNGRSKAEFDHREHNLYFVGGKEENSCIIEPILVEVCIEASEELAQHKCILCDACIDEGKQNKESSLEEEGDENGS